MIPPNACQDIPDSRDYHYLEVFGVGVDLPDYILYDGTTIFNQGSPHTPSTLYACTVYGSVHCVNEGNFLEAEKFGTSLEKEVNPEVIWSQALQLGAKIDSGWSLQGATRLMMNLGCILGYTLCRSVGEVKQALAKGQQVYTGSSRIDWEKTKQNGMVAVEGESYGHAFKFDGYDDDKEHFIMRNSYGPDNYDHGRFYIRYKDFPILFSCYAYADNASPEIRNAQSRIRREMSKKKGFWNGERENDEMTRFEASIMAMRTGGLADNKKLWNGKEANMPVIQKDYRTMIEKATGRKLPFVIKEESHITRGEASEWTVRI